GGARARGSWPRVRPSPPAIIAKFPPSALGVIAAGPTAQAIAAAEPQQGAESWPPIVFYIAKGEGDACGASCSEWIAAEGLIDRRGGGGGGGPADPPGGRPPPPFFLFPRRGVGGGEPGRRGGRRRGGSAGGGAARP